MTTQEHRHERPQGSTGTARKDAEKRAHTNKEQRGRAKGAPKDPKRATATDKVQRCSTKYWCRFLSACTI